MDFKTLQKDKERKKKEKEFLKNLKNCKSKYTYSHVTITWQKEINLILQETVEIIISKFNRYK